jgi:hypothetical protein
VCLVPLPEGRSIDLDDGRSGKGVGADEFVVGGMEGDGDDTDLPRDALRAPREVAGVEAQGAEFAVAATGADKMDALCANTGIGGLATLLESSNAMLRHGRRCNRFMHTSSCGSMTSLHQSRRACGESLGRYWELSAGWPFEIRYYVDGYPMIAVLEKDCKWSS